MSLGTFNFTVLELIETLMFIPEITQKFIRIIVKQLYTLYNAVSILKMEN